MNSYVISKQTNQKEEKRKEKRKKQSGTENMESQ
jgi:hypothetical protein